MKTRGLVWIFAAGGALGLSLFLILRKPPEQDRPNSHGENPIQFLESYGSIDARYDYTGSIEARFRMLIPESRKREALRAIEARFAPYSGWNRKPLPANQRGDVTVEFEKRGDPKGTDRTYVWVADQKGPPASRASLLVVCVVWKNSG